MNSFVAINLNRRPPEELLEEVIQDLFAYTPQEEVVYFQALGRSVAIDDLSAQFPNLRGLHFENVPLLATFLAPGHDWKILPSLQHIFLHRPVVEKNNWYPLVSFLSHCASPGNHLHSLVITGSYFIFPRVEKRARSFVRKFRMIDEAMITWSWSTLSYKNTVCV